MCKVGIPKEIKNNENRVGMTPAGVAELTRRGHEAFVQHTAGRDVRLHWWADRKQRP